MKLKICVGIILLLSVLFLFFAIVLENDSTYKVNKKMIIELEKESKNMKNAAGDNIESMPLKLSSSFADGMIENYKEKVAEHNKKIVISLITSVGFFFVDCILIYFMMKKHIANLKEKNLDLDESKF